MSEMTSEQIKSLTLDEIAVIFMDTWAKQQINRAITWEFGIDVVNIVAHHGNELAAVIRERRKR